MDKDVQILIFAFIGIGMLLAMWMRLDNMANYALGALSGAVVTTAYASGVIQNSVASLKPTETSDANDSSVSDDEMK